MKLKLIFFALLLVPVLVLAQDAPKKKAYYFFGETCPHCKNVDEYFKANGIYDKYEITKLEVMSNPFNGKIFLEIGKAFGKSDWGGVPTIVFEDKYLIGDEPIIESFEKEIANVEAMELPDPEKIKKISENENQNNQAVPVPATNKKNYFPVIIIVLAVVGAGLLFYINRKK